MRRSSLRALAAAAAWASACYVLYAPTLATYLSGCEVLSGETNHSFLARLIVCGKDATKSRGCKKRE